MNKRKEKKAFDSVKMMREIRDKISQETKDLNYEQLRAYIKEKLKKGNVKLIGQS